jgi:hypothetical protein
VGLLLEGRPDRLEGKRPGGSDQRTGTA